MPQTHHEPADGPDRDRKQAQQEQRQQNSPAEPSLLGPKGDPAEGKPDIGQKPN